MNAITSFVLRSQHPRRVKSASRPLDHHKRGRHRTSHVAIPHATLTSKYTLMPDLTANAPCPLAAVSLTLTVVQIRTNRRYLESRYHQVGMDPRITTAEARDTGPCPVPDPMLGDSTGSRDSGLYCFPCFQCDNPAMASWALQACFEYPC